MATNKLKTRGMLQIYESVVIRDCNPETKYEDNRQVVFNLALQEKLQDFGLTANESKTYMFLSKNGPKKAIEISRALNIPRTEIYHLLLILKKKGIVVSSRQIRPKKFSAETIDKAMDSLIENQQKKIEELELLKDDIEYIWNFFSKYHFVLRTKNMMTARVHS